MKLAFKYQHVIKVIILLFIISNIVLAQEEHQLKFEIDKLHLTNNTWRLNFDGKAYYETLKFSENEQIRTFVTNSEKAEIKSLYYLSDTIDIQFDVNKINSNSSGKYLITQTIQKDNKGVTMKKINTHKIIEVSDSLLVIKRVPNGDIFKYEIDNQ